MIWTCSINARQLEGEICTWNLDDSDAETLTMDANFKVEVEFMTGALRFCSRFEV